jgi:AAA domain
MLRTEGFRERVLLMGGWGVGKSNAAVSVAQYLRKTGSDALVYVIDTTYEAERNFIDCDNVRIYQVEEWDEYMKAVKDIREQSRPQDWLVIDRVDVVWEKAQSGYSEKVFGKEIDEWFIEYRKDNGAGHAFSGDYGANWVIIKRMHAAFMTEVMRFKGNVIAASTAVPVSEPSRDGKGGDSKEVRAEFGKFGVRPGGEKNLGFMFHTVLLLAEPQPGTWVYTTIRDRNREQKKGQPMKDFVVSYLIGVAGWKL